MRIAFIGDVAFLGKFDLARDENARERLSYLERELRDFDYVVANLEMPLTSRNFTMTCKSVHLRGDCRNAELLKYIHVNAVSLSNNHVADYGASGIRDTIRVLEGEGIEWFGIGGKSLDVGSGSDRVRISGFCCYSANGTHYGGKRGINPLTAESIRRQAQRDEGDGAFSIFSIHWGMEHTNYPAYEHLQLARRLLAGHRAVLVGHHPHAMQGIEAIGESVAAYSLGNAVFDVCESKNGKIRVPLTEENRKGILLGISISGGMVVECEARGIHIGRDGLEAFDPGEEIRQITGRIGQIGDVGEYERMRKRQFERAAREKFGGHDLGWLSSRLNYYAIGAKVAGIMRGKKYQREKRLFLTGEDF